jgi:integrase
MLEGWATQQRARFLKVNTIGPRLDLVRRFAAFTNQYPWQWESAEAEAFITHAPVAVSTARNYQNTLRLFCGYASDARYGWAARCLEQFGSVPRQILDEWNTVAHVTEFEGQPHRRPLTYDEVQALFDAADGRVEEIRSRGRKGALAAQRDAALLKTVYGKGLRRREAWGLDLADLRHNPQVRQFAHYGAVFVRWGKSSNGSPPKRRTVLTVPRRAARPGWIRYWICTACGPTSPTFSKTAPTSCLCSSRSGTGGGRPRPLGVLDEFRNRLTAKTLRERYADPLGRSRDEEDGYPVAPEAADG